MNQIVIPLEFEQYLQNRIMSGLAPDMNEMIFAYIPDLNPKVTIDRSKGLPDRQYWVYQLGITQAAKLNDDSIVYSVVIPSEVKEFTFNAIYLHDKSTENSCGMVIHKEVETKEQGMSSVRSLVQQYSGAATIANISVTPETWQIDYHVRLYGIDDDNRLVCGDLYGHASFYDDGFLIEKSGGDYICNAGAGYVGGLRSVNNADFVMSNAAVSSTVYLDVCWQGTVLSRWESIWTLVVSATEKTDYTIGTEAHYVTAIASIDASGNVTDLRNIGLDADRLNNLMSSQFLRSDENDTATGQITMNYKGIYPLNIQSPNDGKMVLQGSPSPFLRFREGSIDKAYIQWNANGFIQLVNQECSVALRIKDEIYCDKKGHVYPIWHAGNQGKGSGLDADKLDGLQASQFLRSDEGGLATYTSVAYRFKRADILGSAIGSLKHVFRMEGNSGNKHFFDYKLLRYKKGGSWESSRGRLQYGVDVTFGSYIDFDSSYIAFGILWGNLDEAKIADKMKITIGGVEVIGSLNVSTQVKEQGVRVYSPNNPPPSSQFGLYDPTKIYSCGDTCYTSDTDGKKTFWEWYSNVESLKGKTPLNSTNRQDGWKDNTKPFYWTLYKKSRPGTPLWPWMSMTFPEGTLNVVGNSVPIAVFWRLAEALPELVDLTTGMMNFPATGAEFFRVLDQGRGIDSGRKFASSQGSQNLAHTHNIRLYSKDYVGIGVPDGSGSQTRTGKTASSGGSEARPRNLAFPILVEI